jgi:galactokinase
MEIQGIKDSIAFCEAMGLSNVFKAYAEECSREDIMEIGFNANSGYVYIELENGITIASSMGQRVEYIVTDFETGEESFFDNYTLALNQ